MKNTEFKNIMTEILIKQNAKYSLNDYAFVCSKVWDNGLKQYKGIPIYYFNTVLISDTIYLMPSPYLKD